MTNNALVNNASRRIARAQKTTNPDATPDGRVHAGHHDQPTTNTSTLTKAQKQPTFQRLPVQPGRQNVSFTGRGFIPDYMSDSGYTMMPEASRTTLENEGVHGRLGMMPPAGVQGKLQAGQTLDSGSGGAGSFATTVAFGAKMGG